MIARVVDHFDRPALLRNVLPVRVIEDLLERHLKRLLSVGLNPQLELLVDREAPGLAGDLVHAARRGLLLLALKNSRPRLGAAFFAQLALKPLVMTKHRCSPGRRFRDGILPGGIAARPGLGTRYFERVAGQLVVARTTVSHAHAPGVIDARE